MVQMAYEEAHDVSASYYGTGVEIDVYTYPDGSSAVSLDEDELEDVIEMLQRMKEDVYGQ